MPTKQIRATERDPAFWHQQSVVSHTHPNAIELPRISIVTPSYKQPQYIEETIRSVLTQNYPNLEYIVIDGGSNDETLSIIQKYSDRLAYWVSEPDRGQADAINKGFAHATGDILAWLNSDDLLMPNTLFRIAQVFQENNDINVVTGFRKIINQNSQFVRNELMWLPETDVVRHMCVIAQETTFWRRSVWEAIGGQVNDSYQFAMDYDLWQRMLEAGYQFTFLPHYLGLYRVHESAKSTTMTDTRYTELSRIYQKYNVAQDETAAIARLDQIIGANWRQQILLLKEFGQKGWSNNPEHFYRFFQFINLPVIRPLMVNLHRFYNRLKNRHVY